MRTFYVYILANKSRRTYVGVTNDLMRRVWEHRNGMQRGFTHRYGIGMLIHFETFTDARSAIAREKHLKAMHRPAKIRLIEQHNPDWIDIAAFWYA
jgi:putative endonuclease